jgi:NAD(P)-dependent dehydrogenase (short-subunit alcohol dehydrogenase family)
MGAACGKLLRDAGHNVIGLDVDGSDLNVDLRLETERRRIVEEVSLRCDGKLDGVATFAGISGYTDFGGDDVASVNYFGSVDVIESLQPLLVKSKAPAAVVVSSNVVTLVRGINQTLVDACLSGDELAARAIGFEIGGPGAYAASKFALTRWVRRNAPSARWIGQGIRLNAVAPGFVDTPMTLAMRDRADAARVLSKEPMLVGRPGEPAEVAALVSFLLGPDARFIVGSLIFVDGGADALIRADDWPTMMAHHNETTT